MIPNPDRPISRARDEYVWMEIVPSHPVHGHMVGIVGLQELCTVRLAALVHVTLLSANEEHVILLWIESKASAATWNMVGHII